jgi:hypothetical protein
MTGSGQILRKAILWIFPVLILFAAFCVLVLGGFSRKKHPVIFSFAGWTNDMQGARLAVLTLSNASRLPIHFPGDHHSQALCQVTMLISSQKLGNEEHRFYSNVVGHLWIGWKEMTLQPRCSVDCMLPWLDDYTNGMIEAYYLPQRTIINRVHEAISDLLTRQYAEVWKPVPLVAASWTNSPPGFPPY